jgi:hypothetical protein
MNESIWFFITAAVIPYTAYIQYKYYQLKESAETMQEMILVMAKELKELGSPNVEIFEVEQDD